jgi:hypothetical protein
MVAGYMREVISIRGGSIGIGGRVAANLVPATVAPFYGTRTPSGFSLFARIRPSRMASAGGHGGAMEMGSADPMRGRPRP